MKLQHLVKTGSLPDDAKMGLSSVSSVIGSGLSDLKTSSVPLAPSSGPPAPPPPPGAPPPPPAPGKSLLYYSLKNHNLRKLRWNFILVSGITLDYMFLCPCHRRYRGHIVLGCAYTCMLLHTHIIYMVVLDSG